MHHPILSCLVAFASIVLAMARPVQAADGDTQEIEAALTVAHYYEKGENVIDGQPQPVNIRATTTFRKEGGRWKVIGHHTDTLAYLQKK